MLMDNELILYAMKTCPTNYL